ncbi:MAG: cobalamin-dependent protein [Marinilabiliales bacterium]|nr:cobalamin-dependent protein [Marinilabiliales bacterium]
MIIFRFPVILVAFGDYDNLGVGYLSSVLRREGIETRMIDFRYDDQEILVAIRRHAPLVVGFSVVYEGYIDEFAGLVKCLRKGGVRSHFTAGGYFASLNPGELFRLIPELDSIVRFEGETTFPELVKRIYTGTNWRDIKSIAFRQDDRIVMTPMRPLEKDIDVFPFPARRPLADYIPGVKFATLIAGRGCRYNCSFCNTREFYQTPGGPLKRIRKPETVLDEMEQLYHDKGCIVFLFQDDDFPVKAEGNNDWIKSFCSGLEQRRLHDKIIWKINCRPDEIDVRMFCHDEAAWPVPCIHRP